MSAAVRIGRRRAGPGEPVLVIAEAGVNHNGRLSMAKRLVDAAKAAGADAVKFQTFSAKALALPAAPKAAYQKASGPRESQLAMLERLELSHADFEALFRYCRRAGILFLSTPFDFGSAEFLGRLGVAAFKVGSGDFDNIPLLLRCARFGRPLILSTGMTDAAEAAAVLRRVEGPARGGLVLLHCTSNYPADPADANLRAMRWLERFGHPVGYSDHTPGLAVAVAAAALGACVIEKHLTLDKRLPGPDHKASADPAELAALVRAVRTAEAALGDGEKRLLACERQIRRVVRKSVVTERDVEKGERFTERNLSVKRPGTGLPPAAYLRLLGRRSPRRIPAGRILRERDVA